MSSLTFENNSIMAYVGADADVTGVNNVTALPDWAGDKVYFIAEGVSGKGVRQFDIDPNGDETLQRGIASIGVAGISTANGGAASLSSDGAKLYFTSEAANSVRLAVVRASDLVLLNQFGTASSSLADSDGSRILSVTEQIYMGSLLLTGSLKATGELCELDASLASNTRVGALDEVSSDGVLLGPASGTNAYAIGLPFGNGTVLGDHTAAFGLYHITAGIAKIGTVLPTAIDATWTTIFAVRGIAYDASDGNLIIGVTTTDAGPTNKNYIVKLNASTAAVMWKHAVNAMTSYAWGFTHSRITNGTFHYVGSSSLVYHIKTSDGTATTETFGSLSVTGLQVSDDVTNSIIMYGSFTESGSPPDYLGTYMDTGGHHSVTNKWLRLFFATLGGGGGGGGDGGSQGGLAFSTQRAWAFTLDGHKFYVLDLGAEGTWVIDLTTGETTRWYTEGFSGRWDAVAGAMWGLRIVAADIESTTVWEITATVTTDNDATLQITHVATGGVQTRSRDFHAVNALRVADSNGQLCNTAGATIQLRWSDDNGKTWSDYVSATMTQADYGGEVAYSSLGSFSAPGRVFELVDIGGPIRIDGVDGEIDGMDSDDKPS